jgi:hypothetical protein
MNVGPLGAGVNKYVCELVSSAHRDEVESVELCLLLLVVAVRLLLGCCCLPLGSNEKVCGG